MTDEKSKSLTDGVPCEEHSGCKSFQYCPCPKCGRMGMKPIRPLTEHELAWVLREFERGLRVRQPECYQLRANIEQRDRRIKAAERSDAE